MACFDKISDLTKHPNKYAKFFKASEAGVPPPGPPDPDIPTPPPTSIHCDPLPECIEWMMKYDPASQDLIAGILPRNIASYDEKPCVLGGGRGLSGGKFIYGRRDRTKCKVKDANLELVTIAECVRADGTALAPGFVFSGGGIQPSWARGSPDGKIT